MHVVAEMMKKRYLVDLPGYGYAKISKKKRTYGEIYPLKYYRKNHQLLLGSSAIIGIISYYWDHQLLLGYFMEDQIHLSKTVDI